MQIQHRYGLVAYYLARARQAATRAEGMDSSIGCENLRTLSKVWKLMAALEEKHSTPLMLSVEGLSESLEVAKIRNER